MPKVTFLVAHPPGLIYGSDGSELVFRDPATNATVYCTATATTGVLRRTTRKHLFRGPVATEKDGAAVRVAAVDAPTAGTVELAPEALAAPEDDAEGKDGAEDAPITLKLKKPWFSSANRTVEFRGETYTWQGATRATDGKGKVVARLREPWFYQGKVGDLEVEVGEDGVEGGEVNQEKDREVLEMVLATYVARWWEEKVKEEEAKKEEKELKDKEAKAKKEKVKVEKEKKKHEEEQKGEGA